ncbi:UNVERIFIED_CONTAM: hypothetical protein RMT77_016605 [Armadillidium vulgare]
MIMDPVPSYFDPMLHTHPEAELDLGLENLYKLESLGINEERDQGSIDEYYISKFHEAIEFRDGKYHVELPWYQNILEQVPSNHHVALATMQRVKKKMTSQGLDERYGDIFKEYLREGIIESVEVQPKDFHKFIWIPHRPVIKQALQVTTKIRPVFNCSLKIGNSPSLNQAVYPGVDLIASLFKMLISFRTNKYIVLSDISKAFLQIRLKLEEDRNRFCFFWESDGELLTYRYATIIFGLAVSPYILGAVIKHHAKKYPADLCSSLLMNNLYVDNFLYSSSSVEELEDIFRKATSRMSEGGFNLCSWNTNCNELRNVFEEENMLATHQCDEERVLGYLYNTSQDTLGLSDYSLGIVSTKRQLLSEISKVFDPLSLCLPVTIRGRLLMKMTWAEEMGWDDVLNQDIKNSWEKLSKDLNSLREITFPRSCFESCDSDLSINIFCDASSVAYGFVVYIYSEAVGPNILWSKGKVAPAKGKTLPCLELLSVFLALKCLPQILSSLSGSKFKSLNIFSDSQITLAWVQNKGLKSKQIFVRNRVQDILSMSSALKENHSLIPNFLYVRTEDNPSDLLTRGISFKEFQKNMNFWTKGPKWLSLNKRYWPSSEVETSPVYHTVPVVKEPPVVDMEKYSDLHKLYRIVALLYKFGAISRGVSSNHDTSARLYCLRTMQRYSFPKEIQFLEEVKRDSSFSGQVPHLVNNLNLFLDDNNLIRSKGRLSRCNYYDFNILNPILLSKNHHLTKLIIRDAHMKCKHLGIQATLTNIRLQGFWITSARTSIKGVLQECIICKKFNNFAYRYPRFTNFSKAQVELFRPYSHVGIDYTKHWWIKVKGSAPAQKMFILIYTCLNIRAIYLDLIDDMSSKSFVQSFQRFVNRFGVPDCVYSDNARSFSQGTDFIETFLVSENGSEFLRKNQIAHKRIPLYSPWVGSMWERMIRVVKDCLFKTIGRSSLNYFDFLTILSDIADAINSRPLTYTTSANEVVPLTPNDFLKPLAKTAMALPGAGSENQFWDSSSAQKELMKSLKYSSEKFEEFRTRWYSEYILSLRETSRDLYQTKWDNLIKKDDVILIKSPVKDRPYWQMGVVHELLYGDDQKVRSVYVRTPGGQVNLYPVKHLYPLELSLTHSGSKPASSDITTVIPSDSPSVNLPGGVNPPSSSVMDAGGPSAPVVKNIRPVRKAAEAARKKFLIYDSSEESE